MLARNRGFTVVAVLSLALGIGANTAIFSLLDQAMLEPLPVKNPRELVQVLLAWPSGSRTGNMDYPEFRSLGESHASFSGALMYAARYVNFQSDNVAERIRALLVSGSFYSTLGVNAFMGRTIMGEDDRPSAVPVAVLSYAFWQRRFARSPSVLGKTVYLNGSPFLIVGVMPPEFFGVDRLTVGDIAVPLASVQSPGQVWCLGRLKPGFSLAQARAELAVSLHQALEDMGGELKNWSSWDRQQYLGLKVDLRRAGTGTWGLELMLAERLPLLIMPVVVLLLITCTNVANLLLARGAVRAREISIRLAVGAGRGRICRQLLTESVLLSMLGGLLGLVVAVWAHDLLVSFLPIGSWGVVEFRLNMPVLAFTAVVSILTGIMFGSLPALSLTRRIGVYPALKGEMPPISGRLRLGPTRTLLVVQLAASVVLLVGAALFVRTLRNLQTLDAGFDREHTLLMSIDPRQSRFQGERVVSLFDELTERVRAIPGVRSAAFAEIALFGQGSVQKSLWVEGYSYSPKDNQMVAFNVVGPGFFANAGIPLLLGRDFGPRDRAGAAAPVAIINEAFASKFFPRQDPIGRHFGDAGAGSSGKYEIVGVVKDAKYWTLREQPRPAVFQSLWQSTDSRPVELHVRTAGKPAAMTARIRQEIQSVDKDLVVYDVRTMTEQVNTTLTEERMFALLSTLFSALALGLACVGLYGIAAYAVTRRTNEIGIRMALGATRSNVLWLVLRETMALVAIGAAIGTLAALACARFVQTVLFGLAPNDPASVATAVVALVLVAALACFLPARRAMKVDPMVALRYE
jgi:predicted permease